MRKLKAGTVAKSVVRRIINPTHLWEAGKLQRHRKRDKRVYDDAQLKLYAEILPGDFLHYGYFDDPDRAPEDITLNDIIRAQNRYAELLIQHATDRDPPVLDVGCGMGGLCRMLLERGFSPVALTPDRMQVSHVSAKYPNVPVIHSKFEDIPIDQHTARYGTVFTAESLQYLKLDRALPLLAQVLKPGGRWIACDYFRRNPAHEKSGHNWDEFNGRLAGAGWTITHQQDITPNVLPTLRYAYMWATRFGVPLMQFSFLKLRKKQPDVHYVLQEVLSMLEGVVHDNVEIVNPEKFAQQRRYMLLVMQRST